MNIHELQLFQSQETPRIPVRPLGHVSDFVVEKLPIALQGSRVNTEEIFSEILLSNQPRHFGGCMGKTLSILKRYELSVGSKKATADNFPAARRKTVKVRSVVPTKVPPPAPSHE